MLTYCLATRDTTIKINVFQGPSTRIQRNLVVSKCNFMWEGDYMNKSKNLEQR